MDVSETSLAYQTDGQQNASSMTNVDIQRSIYTVPGILHYLQHEWTRFEVERQQWETERSEFQARIAFLQGERQGQENLKNALVRRIKMLEYALKQERLKFNKLKYGTEQMPIDEPKSTTTNDDENKEDSSPSFNGSSVSFKQGRQLLRQYLKEIGYVDKIIDVRSTAVKKLLGIPSENNVNGNLTDSNIDSKAANESKRIVPNLLKNTTSELSKSELASLIFLKEDQLADDPSDEEIDSSGLMAQSNHNNSLNTSNDSEGVENALHEFDFLSGDGMTTTTTTNPSTDLHSFKVTETNNTDWDIDQSRLNLLKEEYKRKRQGKHPSIVFNSNRTNSHGNNNEQIEHGPVDMTIFENSKNFMEETAMTGLGELKNVTVSDDSDTQYDAQNISTNDSSEFRQSWNIKYILRSHLDAVRCVTFHPVEALVITGSEDRTLKLWNLDKAAVLKKVPNTAQDIEPVYTFRRHSGPVLCVTMNPSGEQFYSGGLDSSITVWNIPHLEVDPYDAYDPSVLSKVLSGHTDAVWQMTMSNEKLLSCSSDRTVRLWDPNLSQPLQSTFNYDSVPLSIDWIMNDTNQFVVTFESLKTILYDTETGKIVMELINDDSTSDSTYRINKILSHPSQPILFTAHDDRKIRYFDKNTGRMIHSMVAHLDSVTSLAVDAQHDYLLSGSHDRSMRLWSLESRNCLQEMTSHQKKDDESIHDVAFHPSKPYMASVGADSIAKIYA